MLQSHPQSEIEAMNYDEQNNQNLDIDPAIILLGIGYVTIIIMAISWTAALVY